MSDCSASIVVYNNPIEMIRTAITSVLPNSVNIELYVIDNSPTDVIKASLEDLPISYTFYGSNAGYGRGHNKAFEQCATSKYHIIINPDIIVSPLAIEALKSFMDANPNIGIVSPKVLSENGSLQPLNKRNPTVLDLFVRRFIPKSLQHLIQHRIDHYEMKDVGYDDICDVECISGCFMFCRAQALRAVGGFDDRYFMYFEDFDLSKKIQEAGYKTVYYPHATVTHLWERASHKSSRMLWVFAVSMFRYFNKWGWKWY